MEDLRDNIPKVRVKCYKENSQRDEGVSEQQFIINLDKAYGFSCDDQVTVLRYSDFPIMMEVSTISELKKKVETYSENAKRVQELKQKLESAEKSHREQIDELKIKHSIEVKKLKEENSLLTRGLNKMKRKVRELNEILRVF